MLRVRKQFVSILICSLKCICEKGIHAHRAFGGYRNHRYTSGDFISGFCPGKGYR